MAEEQPALTKRMRLRYAGTCRVCGSDVAAGDVATYFKTDRQIECLTCNPSASSGSETQRAAPGTPEPPVDIGIAGASARREYERRSEKRERKVREAHPRIGAFLLAVTDNPQSTRAWAVGARGEEVLAARLNDLADQGVLVLHDRRIPGTKANIDHIAVSIAGVFVIDAKRYQGRPTLRVDGGFLRPRTETLLVGRRDCTKLLTGIAHQVDLVTAALARNPDFAGVPVQGMLCFVDADWPLFGGSFTTAGIDVLWPAKASATITADGAVTPTLVDAVHRHLASVFPVA